MNIAYRTAMADDVAACVELRGRTRENAVSAERLAAIGITQESWAREVREGVLIGHVALDKGAIVGYCFGDTGTGEIAVLALYPEWEGRGIGRCVFELTVRQLAGLGFSRLFLGCTPNPQARSYGFYRRLGWTSTGALDANQDEILEYFPAHLA